MRPHPDREASTLAQCAALREKTGPGPFLEPGPGSADARVDLKLLAFEARRALRQRGTPEAEARLAGLDGADLWAGTVQDGTARGFMVALEEAISLCQPAPQEGDGEKPEPEDATVVVQPELRRKRDLLVASDGARVRFTRKGGILLVDRAHDIHVEDCLCFEDRSDTGTLDGFEPPPGERPRLFSPAFLKPVRYETGQSRDQLILEGRLGRRKSGFPCRIEIEGDKARPRIRLSVAVLNEHGDHRLRIRFRGLSDSLRIAHRGTPGWERIEYGSRHFVAATLVRACGRLRLAGGETAAVPGAQCTGWVRHEFTLGGTSEEDERFEER